jgi:predicted metal-dependent peptidase
MDEELMKQALADAAAAQMEKDVRDRETHSPEASANALEFGAPEFDPDRMDVGLQEYVHQVVRDFERRNGRGTLPGTLADLITGLRKAGPAKIPWQAIVKRVISKAVPTEDDELFSMPNRRLAHLIPYGIFPYPSHTQKQGLVAAVIRDSSGSMGGPEIKEVTTVLFSYLKAYPASTIYLVDADTQVQRIWTIKAKEDLPPQVYGRGGTDFIRPIAEVEEQLKPDIIFYGTDGYGSAPSTPPKTPIVWFMTYRSNIPAPYGPAIQIQSGEILRR